MKKILLLLIHTLFLSAAADPALLDYQARYSVCHGKTDYQIANCLLNGNLNYASFRGDRNAYRRISTNKIKQAAKQGNAYSFVMVHLPKTRRYRGLVKFADHLYTVKHEYLCHSYRQ